MSSLIQAIDAWVHGDEPAAQAAQPGAKLPTSGFFTSGRYDFTEGDTTTISPEQQLDALTAAMLDLLSQHPLHVTRHKGTAAQIAYAARQLAESVELYRAGMLQPVTVDERIPF